MLISDHAITRMRERFYWAADLTPEQRSTILARVASKGTVVASCCIVGAYVKALPYFGKPLCVVVQPDPDSGMMCKTTLTYDQARGLGTVDLRTWVDPPWLKPTKRATA